MRRTACWLGLVLALVTPAMEAAPVPPEEAWVFVQTVKGKWAIRVDGGAHRQVDAEPPARPGDPKMVHLPEIQWGLYAWEVDGGKRIVYEELMPETHGPGKQADDLRNRLVIAEPKGKNPKTLLTRLASPGQRTLTADGKAIVCATEKDGKWDVYRVAFEGTEPTKLSQTSGTVGIRFQLLKDGRVAYLAVTGTREEPIVIQGTNFGTLVTKVGTVALTDGKTEKILLKKTSAGLPEFTADGSKMATAGTTEQGEAVVVVTDLRTGESEQFPLSAFHRGWKCKFGKLKFRPDGKALAVTFFLGNVIVRNKGPIPGDEAMQYFGVIWLDGRRQRTALFEIDQPRTERKDFPGLLRLEWTRRPTNN